MLIILDLDNTLLNTSKIKTGLAKALIKFGVSKELFWRAYRKLRKKSFYNHQIYLDYLSKEKEINRQKCAAELKKSDQKIKNYLYKDALWFLKKMKEKSAKLILLSWGDEEFQKIKIKNTKISHFFDKTIITQGAKTPFVLKIAKQTKEPIIFINDDSEENKKIIQKTRKVTVLQLRRKEKDEEAKTAKLSNIPTFVNLKQIEKYLAQIIR